MKILLTTTALVLTLSFSGAALADGHADWYGKEGQDSNPSYMEGAICKLPKKDAAQFRDTMKEARENNEPLEEQIGQLHGELHAILTAETFDRAAFLAKRKEVQQLHDRMETNMSEAFAAAVDGLSQDERVTLTRALHHEKEMHHKHRHAAKNSSQYPTEPKPPISDNGPADGTAK